MLDTLGEIADGSGMTSNTVAPWAPIRQPNTKPNARAYNVATPDGIKFLTYPCDRMTHAQLLAELVAGLLPDGAPVGMMPNATLARCLTLRAAFERFTLKNVSRSIGATRLAWNEFLHAHTVWVCTADDGVGRFECRPNGDRMPDTWSAVMMQPTTFGNLNESGGLI